MEILTALISGVLGVVLLSAMLLLPLRMRFARDLRQKNRDELESVVFRFEDDYFQYIGSEHPDVVAFREMVKAKDLDGIQMNWRRLAASFGKLERAAGHRGRPLIMDYYDWYEIAIKELRARRT